DPGCAGSPAIDRHSGIPVRGCVPQQTSFESPISTPRRPTDRGSAAACPGPYQVPTGGRPRGKINAAGGQLQPVVGQRVASPAVGQRDQRCGSPRATAPPRTPAPARPPPP